MNSPSAASATSALSSDDRFAQFKADISELKLKTSGGTAERLAGRIGVLLMVVAIVVGIGSYVQATNLDNPLDQNELIVLGFTCVSLAIVGSALFLWTRLVAFWRFWMLRQIYEQRATIEELTGRG